MPHTKTRILAGMAMIALPVGLAGCAAPHVANPNEIVIGVAGPMSGELAFFGDQEKRGVELAVEDINAAGGLLGKKLFLQVGDDRCDPSKAPSVARDMVSSKAALVVGHFCSGSSIPASEIYAAQQIIQITPASTNPRLTTDGAAKGWTTLFRVINPDDRQAIYAANWLATKYPHGRIAVLIGDSSYGHAVGDRLLAELKAKNISPVLTSTYVERTTGFSDLVNALKQSKADIVFIGGFHNDFAHIVRQARDAGITAEFAGDDALNTTEFADMAGSAADGVRFTNATVYLTNPDGQKLASRLSGDYASTEAYTMPSYAAVQAWAAAVNRAGTTDGAKVAAAMRSAPIDTVIGKLSWDNEGDIEQLRYGWFIWRNGAFNRETSN